MTPPNADPAVPANARMQYRIENAGLQLSTLAQWSSAVGAGGDLVVFTPPRPADSPFHSNLTVVTRERELAEETDDDLAAAQARALLTLDDALLLDSEPVALGGRPGARALVAYDDGEFELTLEQWLVAVGSRLVVISATVLTFEYAYEAELYEDVVTSVVFDA